LDVEGNGVPGLVGKGGWVGRERMEDRGWRIEDRISIFYPLSSIL
jgi:hypothetical protein